MGWIKNIIFNYVIKYLVKELETIEAKLPEIREFRYALYTKNINQFMKWGMENLADGSLDLLTPIDLVKKKIAPVRDDIEGVIVKVLDGLKPN